MASKDWYDDDSQAVEDDYPILDYEITASPNDFNINTIVDFIQSGVVKIPGFQRQYVWDIKRASKLIESIIMGLPIPQIFLYEASRNTFLVIDGQQRLMSIFYFYKMKFPRKEKRIELRQIFNEYGNIPDDILHNKKYFIDFRLNLPSAVPGRKNKLDKLNFATLRDYRELFNLRTIRNIIIKQTQPDDQDSSIYEIFHRLNTGGVNLRPQEIRTSLYHSPFFVMLEKVNLDPGWRRLLGIKDPDIHMKDEEVILRGFAMLMEGHNYAPSMTKFLNDFSRKCKHLENDEIQYLENLFLSFVENCSELNGKAFYGKTDRFNISIFESVFAAVCGRPCHVGSLVDEPIDKSALKNLKSNEDFIKATQSGTAHKTNVSVRLDTAYQLLA